MNRASKVEAFVTGTKDMEPKEVRKATGVPESTLHRWRAGDRSLSEKNEERVDAYLTGTPMGESREPENVAAMLRRAAQEIADQHSSVDLSALLAEEARAARARAEAFQAATRAVEAEARAAEQRIALLRSCQDSGTDDKPVAGPAPMPSIQTPADNRAPTGRAAGREGGSHRPR